MSKHSKFVVEDEIDAVIAEQPCSRSGVLNCMIELMERLQEAVTVEAVPQETMDSVIAGVRPMVVDALGGEFDAAAGRVLYRAVIDTLAVLEEDPHQLTTVAARFHVEAVAEDALALLR